MKRKVAEDGQECTTTRRMAASSAHPGVEVNEAAFRRGENPHAKYYAEQGEQAAASQVCRSFHFGSKFNS
jgi:pre-mRNA-processing factor 39